MRATQRGTVPGLTAAARGAPTLPQQISCLLEMATVLANDDPKAALALVEQAAGIIRGKLRESQCPLSPAEQRVALLAAGGVSNRQIAEQLYLSPRTVECHLSHAYAKLGVRSKAELAAWWAIDVTPAVSQATTR